MTPFEPVRCDHNGLLLEGYRSRPDRPGRHPAVLIMHNAMGLGAK